MHDHFYTAKIENARGEMSKAARQQQNSSSSASSTCATGGGNTTQKTCIRNPGGGENVFRDSDFMIVWEYSLQDAAQAPSAVDVELQRAKDGTPVRTIAQRVRNQGTFFWSVTQNVPIGGPFRLFVGNMYLYFYY